MLWRLVKFSMAKSNAWNAAMWLKSRTVDRESEARWTANFDEEWYVSQNPDVKASGLPPALHYLFYGYREHREPSPIFNGTYYLSRHPDVHAKGVNPLLHWSVWGSKERRSFAPTVVLDLSSEIELEDEPPAEPEITVRVSPLVSIVITSFNYGRYLEGAIRSILNQTFTNIEIIVVEGGSTDPESVQMCRELERTFAGTVSFLYRNEPRLAGDNRNTGIAAAKGRYICCLDADDILLPTYIEVAVFLLERERLDFVSSSLQGMGDSDIQWRITDPNWPGILNENQVSTTAVFRKEMWTALGGYRDWGKGAEHVPEDWDIWIRALGNGFQGAGIRRPLLRYRVHEHSLSHGSGHLDNARWRTALHESNASLATRPTPLQCPAAPVVAADLESFAVQPAEGRCVLFALPFLTTGGAEKIFKILGESIIAQKGRVLIVTTLELAASIPDRTQEFEELTPYVYPLPALFPLRVEAWAPFISHLIRTHAVDTIYLAGCDFVYRMLPQLRAAFPQVAVVDQLFNGEVHYPTNRLYRNHIDMTIVPSSLLSERLVVETDEARDKIAVIPHGVHMPEEFVQDPAKAAAAATFPEDFQGMKIVSFFGRLSHEKSPLDFIDIAKRLSRRGDVRFCLTGEGPLQEQVADRIRKRNLTGVVYTPGFVPDPVPYIAASNVVVIPSNLDGMPLVIFEAQLLSRPVVASRVGSIPKVIQHGVTGFLCEAGDIDEFADTIASLLDSESLAQTVGEQGRNAAIANHSASAMNEDYAKAFDAAKVNAGRKLQPRTP